MVEFPAFLRLSDVPLILSPSASIRVIRGLSLFHFRQAFVRKRLKFPCMIAVMSSSR